MSYSFHGRTHSVNGKAKEEARAAIAAKFDEVESQQKMHVHDRKVSEAVAMAFVGAVREPAEGEQISWSVSGSVGWSGSFDGQNTDLPLSSCNVSCSINVGKYE